MDSALRNLVRQRAGNRCEFCGLQQEQEPFHRFHVEYIVPRQHGGSDDPTNLALACYYCNLNKGPNLTAIDPVTRKITSLFHPRHDSWKEHFARIETEIVGLTPEGRATIRLLKMNSAARLKLRYD